MDTRIDTRLKEGTFCLVCSKCGYTDGPYEGGLEQASAQASKTTHALFNKCVQCGGELVIYINPIAAK